MPGEALLLRFNLKMQIPVISSDSAFVSSSSAELLQAGSHLLPATGMSLAELLILSQSIITRDPINKDPKLL